MKYNNMGDYNNGNQGYDPSAGQGYYNNPAGEYYVDGSATSSAAAPMMMYPGVNASEAQAYYAEVASGMYDPSAAAAAAVYGGMEMAMGMAGDPSSYYAQGYGGDHSTTGYGADLGATGYSIPPADAADAAKDGTFYELGEIVPQTMSGYPVSALAYDAAYQAMYMASTTQSMSSTRWNRHRGGGHHARASMLVTHDTVDGMLYSSVAGHPEASPSTLQTVYECMFGISKTVPLPPSRLHIPPHAYRAPFGSSQVETPVTVVGSSAGGSRNTKQHHTHMGITTILPLDGYAATISPAAVRIHTHGGMQVHDYDIEGMMSGTIHPHSDQGPTHISVGGIPCNTADGKHRGGGGGQQEIHCMDLWQGLRIVSSRSFKDRYEKQVGVTALATSHDRGSIVAGCSDGHLRILDGSLRKVAAVQCHKGGVSSMAISPDGMLIATTGYSSRVTGNKDSSILYAFPDPTVYIYDIRRLGRAGIPHPFAGVRGSPHRVSFIPDLTGFPSNRLVVASGQSGGGLQVMVPFEAQDDDTTTSFVLPRLEQGESISAMAQVDGDLALGTSQGRVLTYKYAGYGANKTRTTTTTTTTPTITTKGMGSTLLPSRLGKASGASIAFSSSSLTTQKEKQLLVMPSYIPPIPPISLDPKLLLTGTDPGVRPGTDEQVRALLSSYVLQTDPKLSSIGNSSEEALPQFGPLVGARGSIMPILPSARRTVAASFIGDAKPAEGDFIITIPASKLELDLLADHNPVSKRYKGKKAREPKPNPNKFLYNLKLSSICYDDGGKRKYRGQRSTGSSGDIPEEIPPRYRLQLRPHFRSSGAFDPCDHNDTGLFPGWDYRPSMPNSFATPVLLMLYFVPELRSAVLGAQYNEKLFSLRGYEKALSPELGFLFHQIESISENGLLHPIKLGSDPLRARIGAWVPSNFLTTLSAMPEAEQLQILDGSPAAVDPPRRPEAFYRFLAYQLDKELSKHSDTKLLDSLHGIDFVSSNHFITGSSPPSYSSTRAMTLDLSYDIVPKGEDKKAIKFGELLHHSLCRETRLRAWNSKSKAYETIVQRKIVTSLPQVLTIAGSCAGRKEEDGLWVWRTDDGEPFLPEVVEVELQDDGAIVVRQLKVDESSGEEVWTTFSGRSSLPAVVSKLVSDASTKQKVRYQLDAVLSFVNDDVESSDDDESNGHHVLHARVPLSYKKRALAKQQEKVEEILSKEPDPKKLVLTAGLKPELFQKRAERVKQQLAACDEENSTSWVLYNGFAVSNTVVEDARAFHVSFKEPCLLVYRTVDAGDGLESKEKNEVSNFPSVSIPPYVMNARSLASQSSRSSKSFNTDNIYEGKLLAFDAEFVSVQEEESTLLETGSKVVLRDTRHAVGRISIIDCETREAIIDDHVLPKERVVDYLTRFSGIVAEDLDPTKTTHSLISTRSAYLKLRYLMDQGCIFVGHGLRQDFATVNLVVPPNQVLDTVHIYHQPGMRYISLRFLANYVLGRDMQQDVHDSVEDAMAAFELYEKALQWKDEGVFDKKLQEIYSYGQKTDWKLGVIDKS